MTTRQAPIIGAALLVLLAVVGTQVGSAVAFDHVLAAGRTWLNF